MSGHHLSAVSDELRDILQQMDSEQVNALADLLVKAPRVFVAGAGRSGLMVRAFAMRLMHLGLEAHVVGEVTTPPIAQGDVLLIGSGSGRTPGLVLHAKQAVASGAHVVLVTASPGSAIGALSTSCVCIPAPTPKTGSTGAHASVQPMGTLFEQCLLIVLDVVVLLLMERRGVPAERMFGRHANLE